MINDEIILYRKDLNISKNFIKIEDIRLYSFKNSSISYDEIKKIPTILYIEDNLNIKILKDARSKYIKGNKIQRAIY